MAVAPRAAASWRAARSIGSVRSVAITLSVNPAKASAVWPPPVAMSSTRAGARRRPRSISHSRSGPPA